MNDAWITAAGVCTWFGPGVECLASALRQTSTGRSPLCMQGTDDSAAREADGESAPALLERCFRQLEAGCTDRRDQLRCFSTALVLGAGIGCPQPWRASAAPQFLDTAVNFSDFCEHRLADEVRSRCGLRGPSLVLNTACASTALAVGVAADLVSSGVHERAIVGGGEPLHWFDVHGFRAARLLSAAGAKPFDRERDGLSLRAGAGLILVERQAGPNPPLARIRGWATNNEAAAIAAPEEDGASLAACILEALERSELRPDQIDYINAHGTGTPANDASEVRALARVWPSARRAPYVSSTKGLHGHLRAASGIVELVVSMVCLRDGMVPPNYGAVSPDPLCDSRFVIGGVKQVPITRAMSISRGFGGANVVLVLEAPPADACRQDHEVAA